MKRPQIAVCVEANGDSLHRITLSLSPTFRLEGALFPELSSWFDTYLAGTPIPFPITPKGPCFHEKSWKALSTIPFGSTQSYGQIAALLGQPNAARAVGNACNKNPWPLLIPCHRVIQTNGKIGGFAIDLEIKQRLLEFERSVALRSQNTD
ncbi:MAG: methylated-DNA--[protein]-cysteine S-methyltransferase [Verrucomicrobiota bacterium]|nr:methylated-DNA--[protein]-cysteine S-methyltransferase [Verrucomicrobiota bacterium]